jgi:hypothetical protein
MAGTTIHYQVVIFTHQHSISGEILLYGQRFSDFLKDRSEKKVILYNASVARLESPDKVLEKTVVSILPKSGIVLAYEPLPKAAIPLQFIKKYPKEKYDVFIIMDGMEIRGALHMQGSLNLAVIMAESDESFLPITQATVSIEANPNFLLQQETVVINTQRIRFIGEVKTKGTAELKP